MLRRIENQKRKNSKNRGMNSVVRDTKNGWRRWSVNAFHVYSAVLFPVNRLCGCCFSSILRSFSIRVLCINNSSTTRRQIYSHFSTSDESEKRENPFSDLLLFSSQFSLSLRDFENILIAAMFILFVCRFFFSSAKSKIRHSTTNRKLRDKRSRCVSLWKHLNEKQFCSIHTKWFRSLVFLERRLLRWKRPSNRRKRKSKSTMENSKICHSFLLFIFDFMIIQ